MARSSNARIVEWGTPPEPVPTGWDAVIVELEDKAGEWASLGEFAAASARKTVSAKLPPSRGFEARYAPTDTEGRVVLWVRKTAPAARSGKKADDAATTTPATTRAPKSPTV